MANIFDYLAWRKDVPFTVSPFNEVDGLVLSELIYADFSGCVAEDGEKVPLSAVRERFWQRHTKEEIMADDSFTQTAPFLMDDMLDGARFAGTSVSWFYDVVDTAADIQLAVVTFWLPDGTAFVAFRGTDSTIVGWKEDFLLSYLPETEGQRRAAAYMDAHFSDLDVPVRVGGHSKGGNLAVYAAVAACPTVRNRITAVYSNDGPGFLDAFTQSEAYREMLPRIISIVPEESMIGTLLSNEAYQHVVKSTASGIIQHDGFSWQVLGTRFVEVDKRSDGSYLTENTLKEWLGGMNGDDRRLFVGTLFGLLEATGAETIPQIKQDVVGALNSMRKMLETIPKEDRDAVWAIVTKLLKMGGENVWQEAKKGLSAFLESRAVRDKEKKPAGELKEEN